ELRGNGHRYVSRCRRYGGLFPAVTATVETTPVPSHGDAADDPAIWTHPTNPALSVVVATDKRAGLYVYDMRGQALQFLADGKMNNVDLRDGFHLDGRDITIVAASNRTQRTISLYRLEPQTRQLTDVADGPQPTELNDPYGLCLYRQPQDGRTFVFVSGDDTRLRQWELRDAGNGRVRAHFVREVPFASQTEGCVADDATGALYVGEEDVALWRLSAAPDGGQAMTAVDRVDANPALRDDIEGASLYDLGDGRGYLIVSSQGNNSYAVYRREGRQEYLGSFVVVASPAAGIDGASETDGLDVTSANLGPGFEHGALVVQDGRNVMPQALQNYKYIPWTAIATALNLEVRR
ncbi:MAG TPA: phytase, partial [Terricaulis sp.]|nr:phytase [Terricaulis sp.]